MKSSQSGRPVRQLLLGLFLAVTASMLQAGPVDCGNKPISLAFFDMGLLYYEKDGQGHGIDKDIVDELAKRTGCKFKTQAMPRARVWADLASGNLDMTTSGIQTPERESFAWSVTTTMTKNYALVRSNVAATTRKREEFLANGQLQFGVVRGFKHGDELDNWLEQLRQAQRVQESSSISLLFEKLKLGRIDGMFAHPVVYRKILQDLNMERDVAVQDWTPGDKGVLGGLMLAKSRFSEAEAGRWQALMRQMHSDGTLEKIFARYVSAAEAKKLADF